MVQPWSGVFIHHANVMRDKLLAEQGKVVDIQNQYFRLTLDSIGEIAFGVSRCAVQLDIHPCIDATVMCQVNVNSQLQQRVPFAEAFDYCQESSQRRVYQPGWHMVRVNQWHGAWRGCRRG